MSNYRVRWVIDEDAQFEECNGEQRPMTESEYKDNEYMRDGKVVPYEDYLEYQGNPERHIYLGCILQRECPHCGMWKEVGSLWNIDFMDDNPEWFAIRIDKAISLEAALALPGYASEVVRELLAEVEENRDDS